MAKIDVKKVAPLEVVEVLRQASRGEIPILLLEDETWDQIYCGNVKLKFGEWQMLVFNDAGDFDYIDSVTAPDGRSSDCECWKLSAWPVDYLTESELASIESIVKCLKPAGA
ncbi:DUF7693 family protein [Burkholderia multivorans]|uniref:DUF7693 family protein n=1 Tax=Burkholderia multivorans TaxID=87883 RepID=UPI000A7A2C9E|nr:hypothetical protein [Burkholderia multivorans]